MGIGPAMHGIFYAGGQWLRPLSLFSFLCHGKSSEFSCGIIRSEDVVLLTGFSLLCYFMSWKFLFTIP
ncbi:hypothetical protein SAMN04487771_104411 [[Clostridium] aminophilum]|uniref:Uncharacterized protein n=1 Tax=[Clostridium] aminophilum TaxID=1526 RepID=A0A1I0H666_9FIRM|nr:hypothetical protein SAMN04487771_104411 [[Clostridium] aminophilum]